jgi:hypothetical protein
LITQNLLGSGIDTDKHSVSQTQQSSHDFVAHSLLVRGRFSAAGSLSFGRN